MSSLILTSVARLMLPLLLFLSVFLLIRGHHLPGGGFVGGLVAASGYVLYALALGTKAARSALPLSPLRLTALGLSLVLAAAALPLFAGEPALTGLWGTFPLPLAGPVKLGTPLLFDVGVYGTVTGVALVILLSLGEE